MPENHIKSEAQHTLPTPARADFIALAPSRFAGLIKVCGVGFLFYYIKERTTCPRQLGAQATSLRQHVTTSVVLSVGLGFMFLLL